MDLIYECKNCKKTNIIKRKEEYDLTKNIDLVKKIYDDSLFEDECPTCKNKVVVPAESLFIDNDYKFILKLNLDNEIKVLMPSEDTIDYKLRIVNDLNELKEKMRIFYSFLDDNVIEVIKFLIKESIDEKYELDLITFHKITNGSLSFVLISKSNEYLGAINYSLIGYNEIKDKIKFDPSVQYVDEKNAKKYIEEVKDLINKNNA